MKSHYVIALLLLVGIGWVQPHSAWANRDPLCPGYLKPGHEIVAPAPGPRALVLSGTPGLTQEEQLLVSRAALRSYRNALIDLGVKPDAAPKRENLAKLLEMSEPFREQLQNALPDFDEYWAALEQDSEIRARMELSESISLDLSAAAERKRQLQAEAEARAELAAESPELAPEEEQHRVLDAYLRAREEVYDLLRLEGPLRDYIRMQDDLRPLAVALEKSLSLISRHVLQEDAAALAKKVDLVQASFSDHPFLLRRIRPNALLPQSHSALVRVEVLPDAGVLDLPGQAHRLRELIVNFLIEGLQARARKLHESTQNRPRETAFAAANRFFTDRHAQKIAKVSQETGIDPDDLLTLNTFYFGQQPRLRQILTFLVESRLEQSAEFRALFWRVVAQANWAISSRRARTVQRYGLEGLVFWENLGEVGEPESSPLAEQGFRAQLTSEKGQAARTPVDLRLAHHLLRPEIENLLRSARNENERAQLEKWIEAKLDRLYRQIRNQLFDGESSFAWRVVQPSAEYPVYIRNGTEYFVRAVELLQPIRHELLLKAAELDGSSAAEPRD